MITLVLYSVSGWPLEVPRRAGRQDKYMCVEMWRWAGSSWCFLPAVLEWRGAVLWQSSAQSVTAAAGMRLRTPRRRSDAFSQVRAAPGRPTHHPHPHPPHSHPHYPSVRLSAEFPTVLTSDCRRLWAAAVRSTPMRGEASRPASNVPSSAQLKPANQIRSLPPSTISSRASFPDGHTGSPWRLEGEATGETLRAFEPLSWCVCDARRVCGRAPTSWRLKIADGASRG